jgi:hypothetical protein
MISNDLSALWKKRGEMKRKKKELHADNVRRRHLRKRSAGIKRKRKKQNNKRLQSTCINYIHRI